MKKTVLALPLTLAATLALEPTGASAGLTTATATSASRAILPTAVPSTDLQRPGLSITNLIANQRFSNELFTVKGTARDNVGVSNVWYQLNGAGWSLASGTTVWSAPVAWRAGTNVFEAYAQDAAGNRSLTSRIACVFVVTSPLTLQTNGWGGISRIGFTRDNLEVGRAYTVRAVPAAGQVFSGWSGTLTVSNNPCTFLMQSNLVLVANFIPNPFLPFADTFSGLFYPADMLGGLTGWTEVTNSGSVTLRVTTNGRFSGKVVLEGTSLPFSGAFDLDLQAQCVVARVGKKPLRVSLQAYMDDLGYTAVPALTGTVGRDGVWSSYLAAHRPMPGNSNALAGVYTMLMTGHGPGCRAATPLLPLGDSPASVTVNRTGSLRMNGTLADGQPLTQTTAVLEDGSWPLFTSLYTGRGLLIGWINLQAPDDFPLLFWKKPPGLSGDRYYTNGFLTGRNVWLTKLAPPTWTNAAVIITGGSLPSPFTNLFTSLTNHLILSNNHVRVLGGEISNLNLTISTNTGLFQGTFIHPATRRASSFKGAILQTNPGDPPVYLGGWFAGAGGWFLGTNQGGNVRLFPE
jgi:hypothetical protein